MRKSYIARLIEIIEGTLSLAEKFHIITKNNKINSVNPSDMPPSWIKIHFKTYPRLDRINLGNAKMPASKLTELLRKRRSTRQFSGLPISKKELSYLLFSYSGLTRLGKTFDDSRRSYPSAGGRYPLEIYPVILNCEGIKNGLYHYNIKENSLEVLLEENLQKWLNRAFGKEEWLKNAAVLFFITGVLGRAHIKYSDRGYRYMLIEAGHLAQNICLLATELGLGTCSIGGFIDDKVNQLLDIEFQKEFSLYVIAVGKI
mgnify:FL=1